MKFTDFKELDLKSWHKGKKSTANILGYQPKYELPKILYKIIRKFTFERGGILKNGLYKLIFQGDYIDTNYKGTFDLSLNFLDQVNLINTYKNDNQFLFKYEKHNYPLNYDIILFNLLKNLSGNPRSAYLLYEELIRNNILHTTSDKLYEFSVSIQNSKKYNNYNINQQQMSYWINLFENMGALKRINSIIFLIPDYTNCFEILKQIFVNSSNELKNANIKIKEIIDFFEKYFFPVLTENQESKRETHKWFGDFINCLIKRKIIEPLLIDDSEAYTILNRKISNIKFKVKVI